ncbi:Glutaredoxin [Gaiella occulta]|uniref:Glutaredoxin n=1 Tax=Gaiella occulta TaxID=1002870 RepID=A0A7M2YVS6_9ACTN|nr:glutaredoxin domain-containing protein [Gaiella occulta]RDI73994.1 Glutaredoxin [Gaiella occulta]
MDADHSTVAVYTLPGCAHCERARALLRRRGISFTEVRGDGVPGFRRMLLELTGRASVPQITIDGAPVGGASDLARLDRRGILVPLARREPFPRARAVRRFNPVGLLAAPFGGTYGLWRHAVDVVERDGRLRERLPVGSAEQAAQLAGLLNERAAAA